MDAKYYFIIGGIIFILMAYIAGSEDNEQETVLYYIGKRVWFGVAKMMFWLEQKVLPHFAVTMLACVNIPAFIDWYTSDGYGYIFSVLVSLAIDFTMLAATLSTRMYTEHKLAVLIGGVVTIANIQCYLYGFETGLRHTLVALLSVLFMLTTMRKTSSVASVKILSSLPKENIERVTKQPLLSSQEISTDLPEGITKEEYDIILQSLKEGMPATKILPEGITQEEYDIILQSLGEGMSARKILPLLRGSNQKKYEKIRLVQGNIPG